MFSMFLLILRICVFFLSANLYCLKWNYKSSFRKTIHNRFSFNHETASWSFPVSLIKHLYHGFQGQSVCTHYSRYGICKFGPACKFDHPINMPPPTMPGLYQQPSYTNSESVEEAGNGGASDATIQ